MFVVDDNVCNISMGCCIGDIAYYNWRYCSHCCLFLVAVLQRFVATVCHFYLFCMVDFQLNFRFSVALYQCVWQGFIKILI